MKEIVFLLLLITLLVSFNTEDGKVQGAVELALIERGLLVDVRIKSALNSETPIPPAKEILNKQIDNLVETMEYRGEMTLKEREYFLIEYENITLYVLFKSQTPEKNIIVKKNSQYYRFEGNKDIELFTLQ